MEHRCSATSHHFYEHFEMPAIWDELNIRVFADTFEGVSSSVESTKMVRAFQAISLVTNFSKRFKDASKKECITLEIQLVIILEVLTFELSKNFSCMFQIRYWNCNFYSIQNIGPMLQVRQFFFCKLLSISHVRIRVETFLSYQTSLLSVSFAKYSLKTDNFCTGILSTNFCKEEIEKLHESMNLRYSKTFWSVPFFIFIVLIRTPMLNDLCFS